MSQPNSDIFNGVQTDPPGGFSSQNETGLAEILQATCPVHRTGQITFRVGASYGYVFLQQGQVVHAMCGTVEGEEAVYLMLSWPAGTFVLNEDILPHKRTISLTWEQLLFEGARRADVGAVVPQQDGPVTTAHPMTQTRMKDNQPKLIISLGEAPPMTVELHHEYTHLGRSDDNELPISEPSISSRHCVFVLSGADVIVRDLNSSNGTYVNGAPVAEAILRPGDTIQVGVIDIKFVPGVRRPRLNTATAAPVKPRSSLPPDAGTTLKLPSNYTRRANVPTIDDSKKDKAFVTGSSAISYDQLASDEPKARGSRGLVITLVALIVIVLAASAAYFFVFLHH